MSSFSIDGNTRLLMNVSNSMDAAESAIQKLSTGENFANPGDCVSERSVANSLITVVSSLNIAQKNVNQASNTLDSAYSLVQGSYDAVSRQRELCMQASSDTIADKERVALNIEFQSLIRQVEEIGKFKYNGISLLDGTFAGNASMTTMKDEKISIYKVDEVNQFTSYGLIGENPMLQEHSTISSTDVMGKDYAYGSINLSGISDGGAGSTIEVNGKKFTAVYKSLSKELESDQFELSINDEETVKNFVKKLNLSDFSDINRASYRAFGDQMEIRYNQDGFYGNDFLVDVKIIDGEKNGKISLHGGSDRRDHARLIIEFDPNTNYSIGDQIEFNSESFIFTHNDDVVLDNHVAVGNSLDETVNNLIDAIRKSNSDANEAFFEYDDQNKQLIITSRNAGMSGNEYSLNVGGGSAFYTFSNSGISKATNESNFVNIAKIADGRSLKNGESPIVGTSISVDEVTFDKSMVGSFGTLSAIFKPGDITNVKNDFEANKVQFQISLNGNIYHTNEIILSGGNKTEDNADGKGFNGLGNKIPGGTELIFQKVGANKTDAGFKMLIKNEGIVLEATDSASKVQEELNYIVKKASDSIQIANVRLGITAPSIQVNDFGLDSIDKFRVAGFLGDCSTLSSCGVTITDEIGTVSARGTLQFEGNASVNDQIYIQGKRIIFGQDVSIGKNITETRDNLLLYLNNSKDASIGAAFYVAGNSNNIIVQHKEKGSIGNEFTLSAKFVHGANIKLNGSYANDGILKNVTLGEKGDHLNNLGAASMISINFDQSSSSNAGAKVSAKYQGELLGEIVLRNAYSDTAGIVEALGKNISNGNFVPGTIESFEELTKILTLNEDRNDPNKIIVSAVIPGVEGNEIEIAITGFVDAEVVGNHTESRDGMFVSAVGGINSSTANDINVIKGQNIEQEVLQFPTELKGRITNFKSFFEEGQVSAKAGDIFVPNSVNFSATVNGQVYSGNVILSGGAVDANNDANGTNYNKLGHFIAPFNRIVLTTEYNDHAIVLSVGESGIDLSGLTKADINHNLATIAEDIEKSVANLLINQRRAIASFDENKTQGTVLHGLKKENVSIQSPFFDSDGSVGYIEPFSVNAKNNTISVIINGSKYFQVLSDNESSGGLGDYYDSTHKVIKGGIDTTIQLIARDTSHDSRQLLVNLQGVNDIDISTDAGVQALEAALNAAFCVEGSTEGLSYQVGASADEVVVLKFKGVTPDEVYKDDTGRSRLDIEINTKFDAQESLRIVENALFYLSVQLASIGSSRAQFTSKANSLSRVIGSMEDSAQNLLNIDIYDASSKQANASLKAQAAVSAMVHSNNLRKTITNSILNS